MPLRVSTMVDSDPPSSLHLSNDQAAQSVIRGFYGSDRLFRDRYQVLKVLGRGGFGVTYLARQATLPGAPPCVIKQLCPKNQNPMALERAKVRFRREARALANLGSHAQIPRLLDYFTLEGEFYLVQEYVEGETLARRVRRQGCYSEAQVKEFLHQMLPVLAFVHRNHIIHRDIKPPNLIHSRDDGRLVLIDFGAVRKFLTNDQESSSFYANATQFVGTPGFAPPEQLALRPCYGSDVYALGVTCLYLLTGLVPIEFESDPATGDLRWQHIVQVSDHFSTVLEKMLKPDPDERYASVEDLQRALDLEPHLASLAHCMNTRTPVATPSAPDSVGYTSRIQRQAQAIRRWRNRRRHQSHQPH